MTNGYVAIDFRGLMRGFRFPATRNNILSRLIRPLETQGFTVHTFFHTYKDKEYCCIPEDFPVTAKRETTDAAAQQEVIKIRDKLFKFPQGWTDKWPRVDGCYADGYLKYHLSTKYVGELRREYSRKHNISYKWVILTSPQMEPQNKLDILPARGELLIPNYSHFGGYYDSFQIASERAAGIMSLQYDWLIEQGQNALKSGKKMNVTAEPLFKAYVDAKIGRPGNLRIRFNRIRHSGSRIDH